MIYIIHGADSGKSRLKLRQIIETKTGEIVYLDGRKVSPEDLIVACETSSLLSANRTVVLENFFQRKLSRDKTDCQNYIFKQKLNPDIIFWENSEIDKNKISRFAKETVIYKFDYPANLFKFLDSLGLVTRLDLLQKFQILVKKNDPELIFSLLVRQFRCLIMVKDSSKNISKLPDWQYFKFKLQSRYFSLEKLLSLYRKLLQLDYQMKSGATPFAKKELLDIYLANI